MISPYRSLADVSPSSALLWTEFRTQFDVNGVRKTENMGRYPGAPRLLTLGDGSTANTIPAQITGRHGLVFSGTQYVDTGIVDVFERTDRFTLFVCTSLATYAGSNDLISTINAADASKGFNLKYGAAEAFECFLVNTVAGNNYMATASVSTRRACQTLCSTYNGSSLAAGVSLFRNGTLANKTVNNDTLTQTIKNGKPILIGARHNGLNKSGQYEGTMHFAAIFPWELSPQQVQYLHRLCMTRINAA